MESAKSGPTRHGPLPRTAPAHKGLTTAICRVAAMEAPDVDGSAASLAASEPGGAPIRRVFCTRACLRLVRGRTRPDRLASRSNRRDAWPLPWLPRRAKRRADDAETRLPAHELVGRALHALSRSCWAGATIVLGGRARTQFEQPWNHISTPCPFDGDFDPVKASSFKYVRYECGDLVQGGHLISLRFGVYSVTEGLAIRLTPRSGTRIPACPD